MGLSIGEAILYPYMSRPSGQGYVYVCVWMDGYGDGKRVVDAKI